MAGGIYEGTSPRRIPIDVIMSSLEDRAKVAKEISELRRSIKRKHASLNRGREESEIHFRTQLKLLIEPLSKISKLKAEKQVVKSENVKDETTTPSSSRFMELDNQDLIKEGKRFRPLGLLKSTVLFPDNKTPRDKRERVRKAPDDEGNVNEESLPKQGRSELDEEMDTTPEEASRIYDEEPMQDERPSPIIAKRVTRADTQKTQDETVYESPHHVLSTPEGRLRTSMFVKMNFKGPLAREYLLGLINDPDDNSDIIYGVYFGDDGDTKIGNAKVTFTDTDSILIGHVTFPPERGLYELMFKKKPDPEIYSAEDMIDYKRILDLTSAHRVNYSPHERIKSNSGYKYTQVIKHLFNKERKGKGFNERTHMVLYPKKAIEYVYWDDPNELCDRLRLLIAERDAGHTGHNNEIISIIEELVERGVIKSKTR